VKPNIGIVMVTFNSYSKLGDFFIEALSSIKDNCLEDCFVVVVDNNSRDSTREVIRRRLDSNLLLLPLPHNVGLPKAYNMGVVYAKMKGLEPSFYFFMNDDVILEPHLLKKLMRILETSDKIGAVQPLIVHRDGILEMGFLLGYTGLVKAVRIQKYPRFINCIVAGAALLVKSKALHEAGLFDNNYFWGYDDVDFVWRLQKLGYITLVDTSVKVWHYGSATLGKIHPLKDYLNTRNRIWTFFKNSMGRIVIYAPFLFLGILFTLILRLRSRNKSSIIKIVEGLIDSLRYLKPYLRHSPYIEGNAMMPTILADALRVSKGIKSIIGVKY